MTKNVCIEYEQQTTARELVCCLQLIRLWQKYIPFY